MVLIINGWLGEVTDFKPGVKDNPEYNVEIQLLRNPMKLRFKHTQFYRENPEYVQTLKRLYDNVRN